MGQLHKHPVEGLPAFFLQRVEERVLPAQGVQLDDLVGRGLDDRHPQDLQQASIQMNNELSYTRSS